MDFSTTLIYFDNMMDRKRIGKVQKLIGNSVSFVKVYDTFVIYVFTRY